MTYYRRRQIANQRPGSRPADTFALFNYNISLVKQLGCHEFKLRYRREFSIFYEFLAASYDMHESEESCFWSAKKITKSSSSGSTSLSGKPIIVAPTAIGSRAKDAAASRASASQAGSMASRTSDLTFFE